MVMYKMYSALKLSCYNDSKYASYREWSSYSDS